MLVNLTDFTDLLILFHFPDHQRVLCPSSLLGPCLHNHAGLRVEQTEPLCGNEFLRTPLLQCALFAMGLAIVLLVVGQQCNGGCVWYILYTLFFFT
jgi:hypothetical protein